MYVPKSDDVMVRVAELTSPGNGGDQLFENIGGTCEGGEGFRDLRGSGEDGANASEDDAEIDFCLAVGRVGGRPSIRR